MSLMHRGLLCCGPFSSTVTAFRAVGREPVRDWLKGLDEAERQAIAGRYAVCRPMGNGLWEIRTDLPTKRTSRILLCFHREHLVALHGFIRKRRARRMKIWRRRGSVRRS